jgi:gliding motility-associated-like protein
MKILLNILFIFTFISVFGQGTTCATMSPMCAGTGSAPMQFPSQTSGTAPGGNNYNCLYSQPGPTWFFVQVGTSGSINLSLSAAHDIDFIIYGPFSSVAMAQAGCGNLGNGGSGQSVVDCSYSATNNEAPSIPNAVVGQVYVVLVTNYWGGSQTISLGQTGGTGGLDCGVLTCNVNSITTNVGACNPYTNTYNLSGTINFGYPPATGQMIVELCSGQQVTINGPFTGSSVPYSFTGLPSGTGPCTVHAYFTDSTACEKTVNFNSPADCDYCMVTAFNASNDSVDCQGVWYTNVNVSFINKPTTGDLVVIDCNNDTTVIASAPFTSPVSATVHSIQGQPTAFSCMLKAQFTAVSCSKSFNSSVPATSLLSINNVTTTDVDCNSKNTGSAIVTATNGSSYSIDGGAVFQSSTTFDSLYAGNYDVIAHDIKGCADTFSIVINEPDSIQISSITPDSAICDGATIALTGTAIGGNGVYNYLWTNNGQIVDSTQIISITPTQDNQQYILTVSESCGSPVAKDSVLVTFTPPIPAAVSTDTLNGCYPVEVNFTNLSPIPNVAHVKYDFGDGYQSVVNGNGPAYHKYETPGVYDFRMTITTVENCVYDSIYNDLIHVYDYPNANFNYSPGKVPMFNPKVDITNSSSYDVTKWWWSLDGAKPNSATTPDVHIEYPQGEVQDYNVKLIVENADGCYDSISKIISVVSDVIVYAPNSFTPDGDSFNEKWRVFTQGLDEYGFTLLIYNRWGEVLWESHNINAEWDGTYGGKIVPDGAYVWVIHAKSSISDQKFEFKGNISILR